MSKFRITGLGLMIIGLSIFWLSYVLVVRNSNLGKENALQEQLESLKKKASNALSNFDASMNWIPRVKNHFANESRFKLLQKKGIEVFIYKHQVPLYWTTNTINVEPLKSSQPSIQKHQSRYLLVKTFSNDSQEIIFTADLISNPEYKFLGASLTAEERANKFSISVNSFENSVKVEIPGLPMFYLLIEEYYPKLLWDYLCLIGLLLFFVGLYLYSKGKQAVHVGVMLIIALGIFLEYCFYDNLVFWNFKSLTLFTPELYASSWYFPNLGVLLLNVGLAYLISHAVVHHFEGRMNKMSESTKWSGWLFFLMLGASYTPFLFWEIGKLVRDSNINFDFYEIHLVNIYTVLALLSILTGFLILYNILKCIRIFTPEISLQKRTMIKGAVVLGMSAWLWYSDSSFMAIISTLCYGFFLFIELIHFFTSLKLQTIPKIIVPCILVSIVFNKYVNEKDIYLRDIIAAKILLQNEKEPSNNLARTEIALNKDLNIVDYFTCEDISKSDFEKRIRQMYFSEYSDDFETYVFDYDTLGQPYREDNPYDFATVDKMYNSDMCKPITLHFALVNERKLKGSYLGKFEAIANDQIYGTYFILMKPKISANHGKLSDIFGKSPLDALFQENQYSYGIYLKNHLSRRYGQYSFSNTLGADSSKTFYTKAGFTHYTFKDDLGNAIVVSKPTKSWLQSISGFTILALCCIFFIFLWYLFVALRQSFLFKSEQYSSFRWGDLAQVKLPTRVRGKLYLSNKLQLYVILVVFLTFIVILAVTINYFSKSYSNRQQAFLWNKTNEIANIINTQANLDAVFSKYQNGIVYDLSNYYNTDINLFDSNGKLLFSSNDRIYDQDLMGNLINPKVFRDLTLGGKSGFINNEKLESLQYISAYYTIFDNDLNIRGYLNLPYFTNRQDLYREISNYSATLLNLFALVFALAALIAYLIAQRITEPLNLIRHQMGLLKLGAKNSQIEWKHNDEIGLLIAEYNKMLHQLDISSQKLAESEREGAWREMAKQVAHEIKNPLTPMKLSLQHLQYAIERGEKNLEEKVKKTANLLINQIDSLSHLAEEFSTFAKMPEAKRQIVHLGGILNDAVALFQEAKNMRMQYSQISEDWMVNVDEFQLSRVFTNILKNALQAIPDDQEGIIQVSAYKVNKNIVIEITDNGVGIPPELKERIFSPNFSTKNSGMGLGLALSKKMVEQFGGSIEFKSRPGKGTTFFVKLPLAKEQ